MQNLNKGALDDLKRGGLVICLLIISFSSAKLAFEWGDSLALIYGVLNATLTIVFTLLLAKQLPCPILWAIRWCAIVLCALVAVFACCASMTTQISLNKNTEYKSLLEEIKTVNADIIDSKRLARDYKADGQTTNYIVQNRQTAELKSDRSSLMREKKKFSRGSGEYSIGETKIYSVIASMFSSKDVDAVATIVSLLIGLAAIFVEITLACEIFGRQIMSPWEQFVSKNKPANSHKTNLLGPNRSKNGVGQDRFEQKQVKKPDVKQDRPEPPTKTKDVEKRAQVKSFMKSYYKTHNKFPTYKMIKDEFSAGSEIVSEVKKEVRGEVACA